MGNERKVLRGEEAAAVMNRILDEGIKPHVEDIAPITMRGDIAVVIFEAGPENIEHAKAIGWDGASHAFRMSSGARKRMARNLESMGDKASARWFAEAHRNGRIYLLVQGGTFLINYQEGRGYSLEPGTNDNGWMN